MADFKSTVSAARPKSNSLRTTIPEAIAKLMELETGDEIVWSVKALSGRVEVTLSKK